MPDLSASIKILLKSASSNHIGLERLPGYSSLKHPVYLFASSLVELSFYSGVFWVELAVVGALVGALNNLSRGLSCLLIYDKINFIWRPGLYKIEVR